MNVLYKYCDQLGIVKILGSLELKLPYVSEVNDPLECLPVFRCSEDKDFKQNHEKAEKHRKIQEEWNQRKGLLLSVSETAQNTVMWAHYSDKHKGVAIGIDFEKIIPGGITMLPVNYPEGQKRLEINISSNVSLEKWRETLFTKSDDWSYEKERREIFIVEQLEALQKQGSACLKEFNGQKTWFLRLNPESIREVILGLYTEESLKLSIQKLIERPELQHVKLYQTEESETYTLNLTEIKSQ